METIEINGKVIRSIDLNGEVWYVASDVAICLGYKKPNNAVKTHCKNITQKTIIDSMGRLQNANVIPESDVFRLISKSKVLSEKSKRNIIKDFGFEDKFVLEDRKELSFINQLETVLKPMGLSGTRQYNVLNYRIDYYIKSLNICIEYDENNHIGYSFEQHEGRQEEIKKELSCKFIRITDDKSDLENIGIVISEILKIKNVDLFA